MTYTDIAEAIGLSYAQEEDALMGYLTEELNLNNNIAVSILNELGVEPEEEKKETARFVIFPEEGVWTAGHQYQVEILDTENLRFLDEEEPTAASVIYNNFNIYGEDVDNLRLRASVKLVPVLQVEGVEVGHVDFLKDAAFIKVYYTLEEGNTGSIDSLTKAKDFVG